MAKSNASGLEGLVSGLSEDSLIRKGLNGLDSLYTDTGAVASHVMDYIKQNKTFQQLYEKIKGVPQARKELMDSIRRYTSDAVSLPGRIRTGIKQYDIGLVTKGIYEKFRDSPGKVASYLKQMIYGQPKRQYPYLEAIGGYVKNMLKYNPLTGFYVKAWDIGKSFGSKAVGVAKGIGKLKDIGLGLGSYFLYGVGAYLLYKVIKGVLTRHNSKKEESKIREAVRREELENMLGRLRSQSNMPSAAVLGPCNVG